MYQDPISPFDEVALNRCQDQPPVSVVTTVAPLGEQQTLYVASFDHPPALDGTVCCPFVITARTAGAVTHSLTRCRKARHQAETGSHAVS